MRTLLSFATLSPAELRDLLARAALVAHGALPPAGAAAPVLLLAARPAPYARLAVEAGAARVGVPTRWFGPDEVRELGDVAAAAPTVAGAASVCVLLGWAAEPAAQFVGAARGRALGVDGGAGCVVGALADLMVLERRGALAAHRVSIVGDASPRALDLATAVASLGGSVAFVHPVGFAPDAERLTLVRDRAAAAGGAVLVTDDLLDGLREATAVFVEPTPTEGAERFRPYILARHQLRVCRPGVALLHRTPERRGAELSTALPDDPGWCGRAQRAAEGLAAAAALSWLLQRDRVSVPGW